MNNPRFADAFLIASPLPRVQQPALAVFVALARLDRNFQRLL